MFTRPRATLGVVLGVTFLMLYAGAAGPNLKGHVFLLPGALGAFVLAVRDVRFER